MRNIEKTIEVASKEIKERQKLTIREIQELTDHKSSFTTDDLLDLIEKAFLFGYGVAKKEV